MDRIRYLLLWCMCTINVIHAQKHHDNKWEQGRVDWDESFASFVPYPDKVLAGLPDERNEHLQPVYLDMVVNMAQWDQPLFALLKGIVARNYRVLSTHHVFIQDQWIYNHTTGILSNCRRVQDPTANPIVIEPVPWENCTRHCTNGGRYCLNHEDIAGAELVKEAARRMCFDVYQEPGSTILWDYMNRFEVANCHGKEGEEMTACSHLVMDSIGPSIQVNINNCLEHMGGFEGDVVHKGLEHELRQEKVLHINQHNAQEELPLLEIDQVPYSGEFYVDKIFRAVCDAFPSNQPSPFACEFCSGCKDVRKCLWRLECDGEPLDADAVQARAPSTNSSTDALRSQTNNDDDDGLLRWQTGFIWGTIAGLTIALICAFREFRTQALIRELAEHRNKLEDDFVEKRNIDALVNEGLDMKVHGGPVTYSPYFSSGLESRTTEIYEEGYSSSGEETAEIQFESDGNPVTGLECPSTDISSSSSDDESDGLGLLVSRLALPSIV